MGPQHRFDMGGMGPPFLPRDMTAGSKSSGMLAAKTGTTELYCLRFFWVNKSARDRIGKIIIVKIITISCPPHLYPRTQPRISWHERGAPAAKFHPPPVQTFSPHPKFQPPPVETFTPARSKTIWRDALAGVSLAQSNTSIGWPLTSRGSEGE